MNESSREDFTIKIVLDVFLQVSQIDPCYCSPDSSLKAELGLNNEDIALIFNHSIRKANLVYPNEPLPNVDSLREIVTTLMKLDVKHNSQAA